MPEDEKRWTTIAKPPRDERTGEHRWTQDAAERLVDHPVSVQEKVERIHDLARDQQVAARVATDLLRRSGDALNRRFSPRRPADPAAKSRVSHRAELCLTRRPQGDSARWCGTSARLECRYTAKCLPKACRRHGSYFGPRWSVDKTRHTPRRPPRSTWRWLETWRTR
ncbi:DUF6192 family protein [Nonomuraea sp. NPDC050643]|uniref:DUF6192 family protein n=1 Tax=Nonomuraea sp. NPDC050643 TaxID=3155660 RepID=UPI0033F98B0C